MNAMSLFSGTVCSNPLFVLATWLVLLGWSRGIWGWIDGCFPRLSSRSCGEKLGPACQDSTPDLGLIAAILGTAYGGLIEPPFWVPMSAGPCRLNLPRRVLAALGVRGLLRQGV